MTPAPLTGLESHGGASEGIKGGVTTLEDERGLLVYVLYAAVVREGLPRFICVCLFD